MKRRTIINTNRFPVIATLAIWLCSTVNAQEFLTIEKGKVCHSGFGGTWIIGDVCALGNRMELKTDDAIDIQCDGQTGRWSVDFYVEPAGVDLNDPVSQATRYGLCPGNGYLGEDEDGQPVLRCNYWEPASHVTKQLEFALQPSTKPGIKHMSWLSRELDNPNVVCGIVNRGDDGSASGSGGQTIDGD